MFNFKKIEPSKKVNSNQNPPNESYKGETIKMKTQQKYQELLLSLSRCEEEEAWNEEINKVDCIFGQEEGYFKSRYNNRNKFFNDCDYLEEDFYEWVGEGTYDFEAYLERTILCQFFRRMSPEEMAEFVSKEGYVCKKRFGETTWELTSSLGKQDYYVRPVGFELYHNFRE